MTEQDMLNIARSVVADALTELADRDRDAGRKQQAERIMGVAEGVRGKVDTTKPISPDKDFWDSLEKNFEQTYHGGYRSQNEIGIFRHGMATVFNYLRANSVSLFGRVAFSSMREQMEQAIKERDEARKELAWFKDRLGEIAKHGRVQE